MNLAEERETLEQWTEEKRKKLLSYGSDHKAARAEIERIREELWYEEEKIKNGFKKLSLRDDYSLIGAALRPVSEKHLVFGELIKEVIDQFEFEPTIEKRVSQRLFDDPQGHWKVWNILALFLLGAGTAWFVLDIIGLGVFIDNLVGLPVMPRGKYINPYHIIFYFIVGFIWAMPGAHRLLTPKVNKRIAIGLLVGTGLFASFFITKPSEDFYVASQPLLQGEQAPAGTTSAGTTPAASTDTHRGWAEKEFVKLFDSYFTKYGDKYYVVAVHLDESFLNKYGESGTGLVEIPLLEPSVAQEQGSPVDDANGIAFRGTGTIEMQSVRYLLKGEGWTCYKLGPYKEGIVFTRWKDGKTLVQSRLLRGHYTKPTEQEIKEALAKPANQDCL